MQSRRKFLSSLALGSAAVVLSNPLISCAAEGNRKLKNFGYISGIIKDEIKADWKSALAQTADMGYTEIETGNYYGESADQFLAYCKEIGLKTIAGGTKLHQDEDELKASLEKLNELELKYAVIYWPWLVGAPFSLEDCKKSAELLNNIGEVCKEYGLQLCWHNHDNEFIPMEEGLPFDYLMNNTDEELVKCELDVYWVKKGGADPVEILRKYEGRYPILHLKDMAEGEEEDFACVGNGIVDFPAILAEAYKQNIQHYFVERDKVVDGMACLDSASEYLKNLRF
jgi:sugar phosphate isomerase/epimerase